MPKLLNLCVVDEVMRVEDDATMETGRNLACRAGLLCGIGSGAAAWAALEVAKRTENRGALIGVMCPHSGEWYLSTKLFPE